MFFLNFSGYPYEITKGGYYCSDKANEIQSAAECKKAAKQLGVSWGGSFMPSSGDNSFPACFHKTNYADKCDRIWFNLSPNPRRNHAARTHSAICNVAGKILKP